MREDQVEILDKLFPEGYVIVYTVPKGLRIHKHNPQLMEALESLYGFMASDLMDEEEPLEGSDDG